MLIDFGATLDFRQFRYFTTAAEELHFARAAEKLGIAQPALSQQIRTLEDQLGVLLFRRANRRVELTEAGTAFLAEARQALASAEKAARVARETARGEAGSIDLGFVGSVMYRPTFPLLLRQHDLEHPGVQLQLHEMAVLPQIEGLQAHRLDIGIARGPLSPNLPEELSTFILASQRIVAVLPEAHPLASAPGLALAQLADEAFLTFDDPPGMGLGHLLLTLCREAGFRPAIHIRLGGVATLMSLVAAGHGVSLIPESASVLRTPGARFVPLEGVEAYSELLVLHRRFESSPAVKALLARIRKASPLLG
ncbi:MAG: hypothetical protein H6Q00_3208 [Holophagaceae bacterium]|nr:hypothetical protein [Holophagaceae bacterium]